MEELKKLVEKYIKGNAIANLEEKNMDEYIDVEFDKNDIPQLFIDIANDLTNKVIEFEFKEEDGDAFHPFINCNDKLSAELGFRTITICPYKGRIHNPLLMSNYMAMGYGEFLNITFDIYNVYKLNKKVIFYLILQELFNFKRDLEELENN